MTYDEYMDELDSIRSARRMAEWKLESNDRMAAAEWARKSLAMSASLDERVTQRLTERTETESLLYNLGKAASEYYVMIETGYVPDGKTRQRVKDRLFDLLYFVRGER